VQATTLHKMYVTDAVETVAPQRLIVMLYDRLCLDLVRAREAIERRDLEAAHLSLVHAQDIVLELHASLDPTKWNAAQVLGDLYVFVLDQLVSANIKKDAATVTACLEILEPLRDAWTNVAGLGDAQPLSAA
jgi:flagellar secretion chaperone FliS